MSFFGGLRSQKSVPEDPVETDTPRQPAPVKRQPVAFETVIGSSSTLYGELRSQADVRIDGTFEGTLEIEGNVLVGETGKINADIHARNVSVAGAVRGDISGKKVQLLRTARVWGNISALAITTEEGAFIDGKLTMVHHEASTEGMELSLPAPKPSESDHIEVVEGEPVAEEDD
jgi:cytoskeletal protein CcmA (bactofilin family)